MVTLEYVVRPRPLVTITEAIWTDRTPVKPLTLDVRHQLDRLNSTRLILLYFPDPVFVFTVC